MSEKNYIVLPKTSDQSLLAKYYSLADLFVICSKRENFPTTCIEAQCCGTPVIGFDTGGTKETSLLSPDDFVEYGNIQELAKTAVRVLEHHPNDLEKIAHNAFSKETMVRNYLEEYDRSGRKERILLIDVNCKHSSTGKIVYDLFSGIKNDGREACICYGRGEKIHEENIYKFGLDFETDIHAGLARVTGYNGCFSPLSTKRLINRIEEFKPDLIHIHELHAYFVNIKPLIEYIKRKQIPLIWTFHCEYMYTGKCGHAYDCMKFQDQCGNCPSLRDYPKSLWLDQTSRMLKTKKGLFKDLDLTIITPSRWLAERVKLSFLHERPIRVIHNGIDTAVFHKVDIGDMRIELGIPDEFKVVLALAPNIMSEAKGGNLVLALADFLKSERLFFVLVGA